MNKRQTGAYWEARAEEYLAAAGVQILEKNYRIRTGEIDLVGLDGPYLVFFEVKYRSGIRMGEPLLSVNAAKRRQILDTAAHYLYEHHYRTDAPVRFDCVGIMNGRIEWVKNAFGA